MTIGLCMIVKDEAEHIARCLDSCRPLIDYVLVCDTGSTDGTQEIARQWIYEEMDNAGDVFHHRWLDFGTNRSMALADLRRFSGEGSVLLGERSICVDYALMMDADDQLVIDPGFDPVTFKASLDADMYDVLIEHGSILHRRPQIFSNRKEFRYRGVLHEFVEGPPGHTRADAHGFRILAGTEGARSRDPYKYRKDAATLLDALDTEQDPFMCQRYTFYLAQSWKDAGLPTLALPRYLERAAMGGWEGEIYISLWHAAQLMEEIGYPGEQVVGAYLAAHEADPTRAEALQSATRWCHRTGRHHQGYLIGRHGVTIPRPTGPKLFEEPWVYEWGMNDDFAVAAYWAGHYAESSAAAERALEKAPEEHRQRIADNARFARDKITEGMEQRGWVFDRSKPSFSKEELQQLAKTKEMLDGDLVHNENHRMKQREEPRQVAGRHAVEKGERCEPQLRQSSPPDFTVVAVDLPGYIHSGAYADLAETVLYGLRVLGYRAELRHDIDWAAAPSRTIVLGAHLLYNAVLPDGAVIYNTEHFAWVNDNPNYRSVLRYHSGVIWDYSAENSRRLADMLGRPVKHVPIGYVPEMNRIKPSAEQDIDVLFYGALNERRTKILDDLRAAGLKVEYPWGIYGAARDAYIARAKVVLNMHFYLPGVFEAARVSYLLANRKAVVCEVNADEVIDEDLRTGMLCSPYEFLVKDCKYLIENDWDRHALEDAGYGEFEGKPEPNIIRNALRRRVWDCVTYNGEADVLAIRLHELGDVVDQFVIVEADVTHSGQKKAFRFNHDLTENQNLARLLHRKIIYIALENMLETDDPWVRERYQRDQIVRGLDGTSPDDLIIISDVDEIPRAAVVREMADDQRHTAFGLRLAFNYFLLNYRCTEGREADRVWNCAVTKCILDASEGASSLRHVIQDTHYHGAVEKERIIDDAGWHFSYLGDDEAVRRKIRAFAHQEYNTPDVLDNVDVERMVRAGEDLYGRPGYGWRLVGIDDLPEWVKSQPNMMEKWTRRWGVREALTALREDG